MFDTWSDIEYKYYKAMTKDENWCSIIRQKINNIYTRYFDKEVILGKEYMELLKTPKRLYYEWLSGIDMDATTVTEVIDEVIDKSIKVKSRLQMKKMSLSWNEYKKVVEGFLKKAFDNCKLIEEYEDRSKIIKRQKHQMKKIRSSTRSALLSGLQVINEGHIQKLSGLV